MPPFTSTRRDALSAVSLIWPTVTVPLLTVKNALPPLRTMLPNVTVPAVATVMPPVAPPVGMSTFPPPV
jgi:hypothetical protein